jgi:hypothetical protein
MLVKRSGERSNFSAKLQQLLNIELLATFFMPPRVIVAVTRGYESKGELTRLPAQQ